MGEAAIAEGELGFFAVNSLLDVDPAYSHHTVHGTRVMTAICRPYRQY
jgi:hypothetical protein